MSDDKAMRILVVDDFSTMRRILKNTLRQLGYENIVEADDGTDAVRILKTDRVDFIISDWNMPEMSGLDLLKHVRSDDEYKNTPFLMVTAEAQQENILMAVQAGVSNYIVKPFTEDTLKGKMEKILADQK
jgi:two-component system chemotaxis response regulator CheY